MSTISKSKSQASNLLILKEDNYSLQDNKKDSFYESSEDDEKWELGKGEKQEEILPLLNLMSFGWTEDGRCSMYKTNSVQDKKSKYCSQFYTKI
jgi:hypothetical protein